MKSPITPCPPSRLPLVLVAVLPFLPHSLSAQAPGPKAKDEEVLVMSPFTVQTSKDIGYEASRTLAGMGLNTKLTDLGASVSVVTSKFLEDTGSTKLGEVLVYQANMDVKGFGGGFSGVTPAQGGVTGEPTLSNSQTGTRVRGLADATLARNFFRSIIPMEGYNTDRVEMNRGANALLFGVGSPAGIVNTSTTSAELGRDFGSLEFLGGSYGTWRAGLNYNAAPARGEVAFRVSAVKGDERFQQKFAYSDTERKYVAGAWEIKPLRDRGVLDSTTFRAAYESGRIESNKPRVLTPTDRLSSWFDATLPDNLKALGARGKVSYDPTAGPFNVFTASARNATLGVINNVNRSPTFFFQSVNATAPRDNVPTTAAGQALLGRPLVSNNVYYPTTGLTGTAVGAFSREMSRVRLDYGMPDQAFYLAENLRDPSTFDFFNNLLVGPNSLGVSNLMSADLSLQQLAFKRKAGIELSYNRQRWDESLQNLLSESDPYISIDVNTRMWTGEVNPNFGRPFISTAGSASYNEQRIETSRAKLFYELNLAEIWKNQVGGILGKHVFSLLEQREKLRTESHNGGSLFYTADRWTNGNDQNRRAAQSKQIVAWVYLGPSLASATTPSGAQLSGLQQNLMNFHQEVNGKGVVLARLQAPSAAVAQQPAYAVTTQALTVEKEDRRVSHTAGSANLDERTLDSQAFALQSNWLWDTVVSTVGWRREESSILGVSAPADPNGEGFVLVDAPTFSLSNPAIVPQKFSKTLFAWSGVAKMPEKWLRRIPLLTALNVYFGKSENFSPPSGRTIDTFGQEIAPPRGITEEKGLYFEAFEGRFTARVNFFKTTQTGSFNGSVGGVPAAILSLHQQAYNAVKAGAARDGGNGFPVNYVAPPQALLDLFSWRIQNGTGTYTDPGVRDTSDFVTKGKEFEFLFRAMRGLTFVLNVSEQESVRSNTGAATKKLLFGTPTATGKPIATEWLAPWANQVALNVGAVGKEGTNDVNILNNNFQTNVLNRFNTAISGDGALVQELRKWRANFVGNYEFQGERLKGFGVGSGLRWLDKSAIGYPVASFRADLTPVPAGGPALPSDIRISDVRNPHFGPTETRVDAWISYQRKILKGKVDWKTQLNVRNLLTHDELVPVGINPDGKVAVWSIAEGRKFTLSTKFSF
ncbi:MAG: TonB-dependent receptor [Verrucomicrobia bacterium]|nr:TonB-dependent receptor [Verrucomicrobiota bacterium]